MRGYWQHSACAPFEMMPNATVGLGGSSSGNKGGAWSACTHLSHYGLNIAPLFLRFLALQLQPQTALEFGCGLGTTADFLSRFTPGGARVTCIEPQEMHTEVYLRRSLPQRPTQLALNVLGNESAASACVAALSAARFDLVYSLEVAEHIPHELHALLVQVLAQSTRRFLVFSASNVMNGVGHLPSSLRSKSQWRGLFEAAGMVHMPQLSALAVKAAYPERIDIARNVFVMRAAAASGESDVAAVPTLLDRSLVFPHQEALTHGPAAAHKHYLADHGKVISSQRVYEAALWPELAALAASGTCGGKK
jgi:SAM-dependent methyltransferase